MNDISRLNRAERRKIGKKVGIKIPGRNLPFEKKIHNNWKTFAEQRENEIKADEESRETAKK